MLTRKTDRATIKKERKSLHTTPAADGIDFEGIETAGVDRWHNTLQEELRSKS